MLNLGEIVVFHLRSNGDVFLAHWLVTLYIVIFALWLILVILGSWSKK